MSLDLYTHSLVNPLVNDAVLITTTLVTRGGPYVINPDIQIVDGLGGWGAVDRGALETASVRINIRKPKRAGYFLLAS